MSNLLRFQVSQVYLEFFCWPSTFLEHFSKLYSDGRLGYGRWSHDTWSFFGGGSCTVLEFWWIGWGTYAGKLSEISCWVYLSGCSYCRRGILSMCFAPRRSIFLSLFWHFIVESQDNNFKMEESYRSIPLNWNVLLSSKREERFHFFLQCFWTF